MIIVLGYKVLRCYIIQKLLFEVLAVINKTGMNILLLAFWNSYVHTYVGYIFRNGILTHRVYKYPPLIGTTK